MNSRDVLVRCDLFSALDVVALEWLAERSTQLGLSGGDYLCHAGEEARALYIVMTGHLRVEFGAARASLDIGRFEAVGAIGLFSGRDYGASVRAVRDTLLLRIDRGDLLEFVQRHPAAMLTITREMISRLRRVRFNRPRASTLQHRSFAVIPATPGVDVERVARALAAALHGFAPTELVDAARVDAELGPGLSATKIDSGEANGRLIDYLDRVESQAATGFLVYAADHEASPWSRRCMRQADHVLVVVRATDQPQATPMVEDVVGREVTQYVALVVLRELAQPAGDVRGWLARLGTETHFFVRPGMAADHTSLARQLTGRGIGLVLGGGGARGFAHLGLLRALDDLDIPVDLTGGTSMGAFVSALLACGFRYGDAEQCMRETFVTHNYINDYMLPRVSLIRGRKLLGRLREVFGRRQIETLRMPYFCVTTNLTRGVPTVHPDGELAMWVGASMAIPGIAPPVVWKGDLHVDGSVVNSMPSDIMQQYGRGPVIGSDVSTVGTVSAPGVEGPDPEALLHGRGSGEKISLIDILFSTATLTSETGVKMRASHCDCYLRMPLEGVGLFDWKRMDEIVSTGYDYAMKSLEPVRDALLAPDGYAQEQEDPDSLF
ncbi:MAG: cyclic nucleotide-binding domain-containing protein [Nevskiaceae bacterium]|nr:MAG: cyclic nucleotide-binding domain-containing protein [Nevskiaceae bacterium]TBR75115.1 MAG: cyclic nucleotide-binding domain-containing protein [Nevskiaceae bacterium]